MQPRQRTCTYRVVYWESADDKGFVFEEPPLTLSAAQTGKRPTKGPQLCEECEGVTDIWRFNMDYVHAAVRMLAKEGTGFREEIEDFVCVSPHLVLEYHLQKFRRYGWETNKKVLTESVVLGVPMLVHLGAVEPKRSGVGVSHLAEDGSDGVSHACTWLRGYAARIRASAHASGGVSALIVVHPDGVEVNAGGLSKPFFAHDPQPPVTQVIVLVAGPNSFGAGVLREFEAALMGGTEGGGCHVGPLRLSVPSANRAYAALGDLFMCHDREMLLPIIEDLRHLGEEKYRDWLKFLNSAISCLAMSELPLKTKLNVLSSFVKGLGVCRSSPEIAPEDDAATPHAVRSRLQILENTFGLPKLGKRRHWRSHQWIQSSEPSVVLQHLADIAASNCPLKMRWNRLADMLEEHASKIPPQEKRTPNAVLAAFREAYQKRQTSRTSLDLEVPSLPPQIWKLPCEKAVNIIQRMRHAGPQVKDPVMWLASEVKKILGVDDEEDAAAKQQLGPKAPAHPPPSWAVSKTDGALAPSAQPKAALYKTMWALNHKLKMRLRTRNNQQRSPPRHIGNRIERWKSFGQKAEEVSQKVTSALEPRSARRRVGNKMERTKRLGKKAEEALARKRSQPDANDQLVRTPSPERSPERSPKKDDVAEPKAFPKALAAKRQRRPRSASPRSNSGSQQADSVAPLPPEPPQPHPEPQVPRAERATNKSNAIKKSNKLAHWRSKLDRRALQVLAKLDSDAADDILSKINSETRNPSASVLALARGKY